MALVVLYLWCVSKIFGELILNRMRLSAVVSCDFYHTKDDFSDTFLNRSSVVSYCVFRPKWSLSRRSVLFHVTHPGDRFELTGSPYLQIRLTFDNAEWPGWLAEIGEWLNESVFKDCPPGSQSWGGQSWDSPSLRCPHLQQSLVYVFLRSMWLILWEKLVDNSFLRIIQFGQIFHKIIWRRKVGRKYRGAVNWAKIFWPKV